MSSRHGIEWFPMATDIFTDDENVFDLMDVGDPEHGYALFGRYVALICRVYREGFALEVNGRTRRKLARDLDLTTDDLDAFMGELCRSGLIDEGMWRDEGVITSRGIQRRWKQAMKRYKPAKSMRRWWLLDEDESQSQGSAETSAHCGATEQFERAGEGRSEKCGEVRTNAEKFGPEKIREEEIRKDERRGEDKEVHPLVSEGGKTDFGSCPGCLMQPKPGNGVFLDAKSLPHRTAYGALEARYRETTRRGDFASLMAEVAKTCPGGCRASPDDVAECHSLIAKALDKCDSSKGRPHALVCKILSEDRSPHG